LPLQLPENLRQRLGDWAAAGDGGGGKLVVADLLVSIKRVMLVVPLLNSSIRYFSFTMNSSVIVCE
jgi:hypothetical protein